jgi:hypothetical protein
MIEKYKSYEIWPNTKTVYHKSPTGYEYSTQEKAKGFYVDGSGISIARIFKTVESAKEQIDFVLKFNLRNNNVNH